MVLTSFKIGLVQASRNWRMVVLLVVVSILVATPVAIPIAGLVAQTTAFRPVADHMLSDNLDVTWLADLFNEQLAGASLTSFMAQLGWTLIFAAVMYLVSNVLFTGGLLEVLSTRDATFTMRRFWAGAGTYFWRFVRLWGISLAVYAAIFVVYFIVLGVIGQAESTATTEAPGAIKKWVATGVLVVAFGLVNLVFVYARIGTVINGSRKMVRETVRASSIVARNFLSISSLYVLVAVLGVASFTLLAVLRGLVVQSSLTMVLIALLLGQFAIAARLWSRVVLYGAQLHFYREVAPAVVLVPPVVRVTPEFAVATDESLIDVSEPDQQ